MKRILIVPAVAALLTSAAANAQETNADTPAVNAPEAVIYSEDQPGLDDMSIQDLNALQLARLEQDAYDIASETGDKPVIAAKDADSDGEPVFTTAAGDETGAAATDDETAAMGGPYYESEEDAIADSDLTQPPKADTKAPSDKPADTPQDN